MIMHTKLGFLIKCLLTAVLPTFLSLGGGFSLLNAACAVPSDACWESGFHQPGVSGTVHALVRDNAGNIYVGGEISAAGGVPVNNLAKWDGTTWRDVGGGITNTAGTARVYALAVDANDNLVVGGDFTHAGGTTAGSLAAWNGAEWQGVGGGVNGSVMAIKVVSGSLQSAQACTSADFSVRSGPWRLTTSPIVISTTGWQTLGGGITYPGETALGERN